MTQPSIEDFPLPRPGSPADRGPLDDHFYELVETRFRRVIHDHPEFATFIGIHSEDHRLANGERDAVLGEIAADRAHLAAVEAIDPAGLSPLGRFERDLEIHNVRRDIFDADVQRTWEQRSTALDGVGDPLFALFARDFSPLPERLDAMASRMEAVPGVPRGVEVASGRCPRSDCGRRSRSRPPARSPPCSTRSSPPARAPSGRSSSAASPPPPRVRSQPSPTTASGSAGRSRAGPTRGRSGGSATTSWSACAPSTASTPTRSSRSATSSSP